MLNDFDRSDAPRLSTVTWATDDNERYGVYGGSE